MWCKGIEDAALKKQTSLIFKLRRKCISAEQASWPAAEPESVTTLQNLQCSAVQCRSLLCKAVHGLSGVCSNAAHSFPPSDVPFNNHIYQPSLLGLQFRALMRHVLCLGRHSIWFKALNVQRSCCLFVLFWEYQPVKIPRVGRLDLDNATLEAITQLRPNSCRRPAGLMLAS